MEQRPYIRVYSRAERVSDGVVHVVGLTLALVAVPFLLVLTAMYRGQPAALAGTAIYGITLIMMLGFSALYNMTHGSAWTGVLQRLDHSAIYLKIAGTYTPFILLSAAEPSGLLVGLWVAAVMGMVLKTLAPGRFRWIALSLYLAMGWAGVLAGGAIFADLAPWIVWLMAVGGIVYTAGIVFFLYQSLPFHNTIWHVFVLAGSVVFFISVAGRIAGLPAPAM